MNLRIGDDIAVGSTIHPKIGAEGLHTATVRSRKSVPAGSTNGGTERGSAVEADARQQIDEVCTAFIDDTAELKRVKLSNKSTVLHLFSLSVVQNMSDQIRACANEMFDDIFLKVTQKTHAFRDAEDGYRSDDFDYCVS